MLRYRIILASLLALLFSSCQNQDNKANTQQLKQSSQGLILGGELGNSSATCEADIEKNFSYLSAWGVKTLLVPVSWAQYEREEGVFDFSLTQYMLDQARSNGQSLVFLWFGAWKNSMSCYAPDWFKKDSERFPRARTSTGKALEIASAFSENVFKADSTAFIHWLEELMQADKDYGTVRMIQIENEIGMLEEARDHSAAADSAFALFPWYETYGESIYTDERFMATYYARYVEKLARAARQICDLPLYVNAALNSRGRVPGQYPSAGPLAHLSDIWKTEAPSVDFISPDIYDSGYKDWIKQYDFEGNPLFIPEIRFDINSGVRAIYAFGEHDAIGFSPFAIEDGTQEALSALESSYKLMDQLEPYLENKDKRGVLFDMQDRSYEYQQGDMLIKAAHFFTLPWDPRASDGSIWPEAGAIIIRLSEEEYLVAGSGVVVEFKSLQEAGISSELKQLGEDGFALDGKRTLPNGKEKYGAVERIGLGEVSEVEIEPDGQMRPIRYLCGDQTHQGRHVRISVGDYKILKVKLYRYQ